MPGGKTTSPSTIPKLPCLPRDRDLQCAQRRRLRCNALADVDGRQLEISCVRVRRSARRSDRRSCRRTGGVTRTVPSPCRASASTSSPTIVLRASNVGAAALTARRQHDRDGCLVVVSGSATLTSFAPASSESIWFACSSNVDASLWPTYARATRAPICSYVSASRRASVRAALPGTGRRPCRRTSSWPGRCSPRPS